MNIGQVKDLSPQNLFHKLEVQISCWIWAQTNPEHIFTSWIQANLCGERNQVAPNRSPDWDVHSRFSNLFQPRATSSSYMLLSPLVTLVSQSVLKQDSHATPITMVLVGATLFFSNKNVWWCIPGIYFMQLCILHLVLLFLQKGQSVHNLYFPRVTVLYTWSCLLSLVRFVESEISSLHVPVKLNLVYQDKRRFGELSLTANLGDPFCGFQHPKCCRNLSIRQQDHFGRLSGQQGIYPPHFWQKSPAFRLQSLLNLNILFLSPEQSDFAQSSSSSSQKQLSFTEIWRTTTPHGC